MQLILSDLPFQDDINELERLTFEITSYINIINFLYNMGKKDEKRYENQWIDYLAKNEIFQAKKNEFSITLQNYLKLPMNSWSIDFKKGVLTYD